MKVLCVPLYLLPNVYTLLYMIPGVQHSILRQVGEGLLGPRSGAGAPAVKSVYRGGKKLCLKSTSPSFGECFIVIVV